MFKKILLSLAIIIGLAAHVTAITYIAKNINQQAEPTVAVVDPTKTVPDLSKDYDACNALETNVIKTTLGDAAQDLQEPSNNGIVGGKEVGTGMENLEFDAQSCVYAFIPGGTFENGYNSNNAFNIVVTKYTNPEGPTTFVEAIRNEALIEEVTDLGDDAFYNANTASTGIGATYNFKLQVFTGKTLVEYSINQPAEKATFTKETAKTALVTLAQKTQLPENN